MDIKASIVDQRVRGIVETKSGLFPADSRNDPVKMRSMAFVALSMQCLLDCTLEDAFDYLTDGGNDLSIDGLYIGDVDDGEFDVWLFQGKYKDKLDGEANFPGSSIQQILLTVGILFDPYKKLEANARLCDSLEEIRSMVRDGLIPNVKIFLCNNGKSWNEEAQGFIDAANLPPSQVSFVHINHEKIFEILQRTKPVDATVQLQGEAFVESMKYKRVLVGRIGVNEIADLFEKYDVQLLERNVRRYLGLRSNRVNSAISETLRDKAKCEDFYFYNNGITVVCDKFQHNALQRSDYSVIIKGMQVVNGGQTCKTIQLTLREHPELRETLSGVSVLLRLYELESQSTDFVIEVTFATNSQNPVELRDLHANDPIQKELEIGFKELGYNYRHKRDDSPAAGRDVIQSSVTAEAVMAMWRHCPHQSKFMRRELFGKLYENVFADLTAPQALLANLIFRFVENERKRPTLAHEEFLPYSGHYVAMRFGVLFLHMNNIKLNDVTFRNITDVLNRFEADRIFLYQRAVADVRRVLDQFYGGRKDLSLQQLSATFRRGDLIEPLLKV